MDKSAKPNEISQTLIKPDPTRPAFKVTGRDLLIRAGIAFDGDHFPEELPVMMPAEGLEPGADYGVVLGHGGVPQAVKLLAGAISEAVFGGFHFAPGCNAQARAGGDEIPAINPNSIWDLKFRPASDPRGMALCQRFGATFWGDIYLTGVDHQLNGTSAFGVTIADGGSPPVNPATGKKFRKFDYPTAQAVMAHHGKGLMSSDEFRAFAFGVTEKTSCKRDPITTGLDAPRTSADGAMQAAGNMWQWGHDGDPDTPRPSFVGGSWINGGDAGSRYAVVDYWPGLSDESLGARGRSDHLQLV